ncbi:MAG: hypothetical protein CMN31_10715 [Sandaracinus sp.]|nr:hypothetical protein [Sandaracinus sp.]MBJ71795.1 hypothetical protein [Sandaracinus sp.]HJK91985.1 hypothetical protein [Polyangiaceae bacterium LLY-WYZ-15_(1-7)]HJL32454.1 hypothetical protein [Polyangiaceae bacterium LLY-WYZ-15_(1-7)]
MVTASSLQRLARLHRRGVDGAGSSLIELARDRPGALAQALGVDRAEVDSLATADGVAELVRSSRSRRRTRGRHDRLTEARRLALELGRQATMGEGGAQLSPNLLGKVAAKRLDATLLFLGPHLERGLDLALLYRAFKACRTAEVVRALVSPCELRLDYRTAVGRGHYRFVLQPALPRDDVVEVPLRPPPEEHLVEVPPPHEEELIGTRSFLDHVIDAFGRVA